MPENEERGSLSERRQRRRARRQEMLRQAGGVDARISDTRATATTAPAATAQGVAITRGKASATPSRRQASESSFLSNFIIFRPIISFWGYLQNVGVEIRKVTWPTRADARRLTGIVLIVTIAAAISLGLISFVLSELFRFGIETPLILLSTFALIVAGTLFRLRRGARSASY